MQAKRMKELGRHKREEKKSLNMKKMGIFIFVILVIVLIMFTIKVITSRNKYSEAKTITSNYDSNAEGNISEKLLEEKTFENLKIQDVKINVKEGVSEFSATVENKGNEDFKAKDVYIIFKQENGDEIIRFRYALKDLKKGSKDEIALVSTVNLTLARDFCIE